MELKKTDRIVGQSTKRSENADTFPSDVGAISVQAVYARAQRMPRQTVIENGGQGHMQKAFFPSPCLGAKKILKSPTKSKYLQCTITRENYTSRTYFSQLLQLRSCGAKSLTMKKPGLPLVCVSHVLPFSGLLLKVKVCPLWLPLLWMQRLQGGFLPVFWDVPKSVMHAVSVFGALVDWLQANIQFGHDSPITWPCSTIRIA